MCGAIPQLPHTPARRDVELRNSHEDLLGCEGVTAGILYLGHTLRGAVSFKPRGKSPLYPLNTKMCRPQSRSGRGLEE